MKRLFLVVALVCATIGSASAQKKDVLALTEELNALQAQNVELQTKINELTAIAESNKVLAEQLRTMVAAYQNLENAYKSNSEQVALLTAKIDELVAASATKDNAPAEAAKPEYEVVGDIKYGLALVKNGMLYGYMNAKGEYVIEAQFEEACDFSEGVAAVKVNDKWGYIDTTGKFVIAAQYQEARSFGENEYHNYARVQINNKWGVINKSGQIVVAAKYGVIRVSNDSTHERWTASIMSTAGSGDYDVIYRDGSVE